MNLGSILHILVVGCSIHTTQQNSRQHIHVIAILSPERQKQDHQHSRE